MMSPGHLLLGLEPCLCGYPEVVRSGSVLHRSGHAIERAQWTLYIVQADRLARVLGTTFSEMLAKVERGADES